MNWEIPDDSEVNQITRRLAPEIIHAMRELSESRAAALTQVWVENQDYVDSDERGLYEWDRYVEEWRRLALDVVEPCESLPEQLLALAFEQGFRDEIGNIVGNEFHVACQYEVQTDLKAYRLDFVVDYWPMSDAEIAVGVECDGHKWHERTPEQAARDKARDRALAEKGFPVLRFTAQEILIDPGRCVEQVRNVLIGMWHRASLVGQAIGQQVAITILANMTRTDADKREK